MKARNLARGRSAIASLPRPSIFSPPRPVTPPTKVYVRDFLRDADIDKLSPPLAAIKRLGKVETDRDGLLDFSELGVQIAVSPDLFVRAIKTYDAVLKEALSRDWITKADDSAHWQIVVSAVPLRLAVTERIEPIPGSHSCTFAMSASCDSAFVAALARIECTQSPFTSAWIPVSRPYLMTMLWITESILACPASARAVRESVRGAFWFLAAVQEGEYPGPEQVRVVLRSSLSIFKTPGIVPYGRAQQQYAALPRSSLAMSPITLDISAGLGFRLARMASAMDPRHVAAPANSSAAGSGFTALNSVPVKRSCSRNSRRSGSGAMSALTESSTFCRRPMLPAGSVSIAVTSTLWRALAAGLPCLDLLQGWVRFAHWMFYC